MDTVRPGFNHKAVFILSILQLSYGALAALFGSIQLISGTELHFFGYGMWTGLFFFIAGILGMTSWKYKNNCNIVGHMVMSIIACVFGLVLLSFAAASVGVNATGHYRNNYYHTGYNSKKFCYFWGSYGDCAGPLALGSLLLIISVLEIVVSIMSCVYCCKAVCCGTRSHGQTQGNTVQYVVSPGGGQPLQQVIIMGSGSYPQQGYAMYPGQQPMYQMQGSVPQGGQIIVHQPAPHGQIADNAQTVPQCQIAYNVQSMPQSQTVYNVQSIPQGQTISNAPAAQPAVVPTQNGTPFSPPAYMTLDRTQTQDGQNYDYVRTNDSAEYGANN